MAPYGIRIEVLAYDRDSDGDLSNERVFAVIDGVAFAPSASASQRASREDNDRKAQVDTMAVLYVPPGNPVISAQHKVRFPDGSVWNVDGKPSPWSSPLTGWTPGGEVHIRRVTG
ncbi:hypothetical protein ACWEOE_28925 [Amycolatopsis sp. NPDC004368]